MTLHESVTHWLTQWGDGDDAAIERVTDAVYVDLKRLAALYLDDEQTGHTLQATALVHEAYLRISSIRDIPWQGRGQFIALVARMMRRILIDHARRRNAAKRSAEAVAWFTEGPKIDVLAVDQALSRMQVEFARAAQVVELRFFGGLELPEVAEALEISLATAERGLALCQGVAAEADDMSRGEQLQLLFDRAVELTAAEREEFLLRECPDREMREELRGLIAIDAEPGNASWGSFGAGD